MTDSSRRHSARDYRGRWMKVATENTPLSADSKFDPMTELEVGSGVPDDFAYDTERRHAPEADDLAQGGQGSPLRSRNPMLVPDGEQAETIYGRHGQGRAGRVAASRGPRGRIPGTDIDMDPSRFLTGASDECA